MLRAPYRPKVAGKIAFFFGPVAGELVSVVNLRRFGYPLKARRVLRWTLLGAAALIIVFILIPDILGQVVGLGAELAFYKIYPRLQGKEFDEWQSAHPDIEPLSGWRALGWGFAGLALFILIGVVEVVALSLLFPSLVR
jgi:hypothetical protein